MVIKRKLIIGPILTYIGGTIMLFAGFLVFRGITSIESNLTIEGLTWADTGFNPIFDAGKINSYFTLRDVRHYWCYHRL